MKPRIAATADRVTAHTAPEVNRAIERRATGSIAHHAAHPEEIDLRLAELDREWDVERALETMSSLVSLGGLSLALLRRRKRWLLLPLAVQGFFLQHALSGWCPPLPLLRRLGFRTPREIEDERHALIALREAGQAPAAVLSGL